ncbi:C3 [Tomato leaf curl Sudan virus]|uniref:Replication enhancer n=1 Tax=Tomato leaf curl Sudan virus TaxID=270146 RepID=A9P496_9GEMI|nr:C3 [Tomato leaf curl Sudan virus]AFI56590.1 replication enhancer protein [Tomato leaf curl Sudan virus]AFI56595.1 replication enhancer protein [Tomato leaf curl Sudan virus]AFI56601.1 replication enhancer protein [Tomato leaf curl Sudan virus]AFI56608.1 replication enhancer protein [Tomato leaf curl Sudan virus]
MDSRTGEPITAHQAQSGVFIWEIKNPLYFKITDHSQRPFLMNHDIISMQIRFNHNIRKELGIHKCFLNFQIWTNLQPQTGRFLRVVRYQVLKYLDNLGVISINNVIRAVHHVLYNVIAKTIDVTENHDIKYKIY